MKTTFDVQAVLCEDNATIMYYLEFDDGEEAIVSRDLPAPIDPETFDYRAAAEQFRADSGGD